MDGVAAADRACVAAEIAVGPAEGAAAGGAAAEGAAGPTDAGVLAAIEALVLRESGVERWDPAAAAERVATLAAQVELAAQRVRFAAYHP